MGRHQLESGQITSYGGDARIIASRGEIERVIGELAALENWLLVQVSFEHSMDEPLRRVRLGLELPPILDRINRVKDACGRAADSYFGAEAEISKELREGETPLNIANIATGFAGIGGLVGEFKETSVSARLTAIVNENLPPRSITELATRLQDVAGRQNGAILIEKFREPAAPVRSATDASIVSAARFVVYIPGTQSWAPFAIDNPFDLTSDISAISKTGFAGSERGVAAAMDQAGILPEDEVLFVGHSQGGMVAANLSERFPSSRVLTFGAPLGQVSDKLQAKTLSVEHRNDPVPKIDGRPNPEKANWVTVRQEIPGLNPIEQHEMKGYVKTAMAIDAAPKVAIRDEFANFAGMGLGQALYFELKREPLG
jgi:hypothetical protein